MASAFYLEQFSSGMKARLDITYRRDEGQLTKIVGQFRREFSPRSQETALPFTRKTRGYGTYRWRNNS